MSGREHGEKVGRGLRWKEDTFQDHAVIYGSDHMCHHVCIFVYIVDTGVQGICTHMLFAPYSLIPEWGRMGVLSMPGTGLDPLLGSLTELAAREA